MSEHCPNKAKFLVPWGDKILKYCAVHAIGLCKLGEAIGSPLKIERISNDNIDCEGNNDLEQYKEED